MRVELPTTPVGNPPGQPGEGIPVAAPRAVPRRPASPLERLAAAATRPGMAWTLASITIALFAWSLLIRQPEGERYLAVSARARAMMGSPAGPTHFTPADLERLQREVGNIKAGLVSNRREILPLLHALETRARQEGWRCERSMMPVQAPASTLTNLELHPVTLRLHPSNGAMPGNYTPLLRWLQAVGQLDKRADIAALQIQADASGIQRAEVRIHFFSLNRDEETPSK